MSAPWPLKPLSELCEFRTGGTPSRSKVEYFENGEVPWLVSGDIHNKIITSCENRITELGLKNSNAKLLPINSVLMALSGQGKTKGTVAMLRAHSISCNQSIACMTPIDGSKLDYQFLYYFLDGMYAKLRGLTGHNDRRGLNLRILKNIEVPVPPMEEQKRIVNILDNATETISNKLYNVEESIHRTENLFSNDLERVFKEKHETWNEMKLHEIGDIQTGTTPKTSERENYGDYISFVKPAAFAKNGTIIHTNDRLSRRGYAKSRPIKPFSVLMVCIGATIGKCGYNVVEITTNQQINSLTPKNNKLYKFLYYQMLTRKFQHSVVSNAGQSTLPCINKRKWSNLSLLVPINENVIQSLISRFDNLRHQCEHLVKIYVQQKSSLIELKQSILQEAFNGNL